MKVTIGEGQQPTAQTSMAAMLQSMGPQAAPQEAAPGEEAALPPPAPAYRPADPNDIGVVFIHGIGDQKPGETLLSWAAPLQRVVSSWRATTHGVKPLVDPTVTSNIDFTGGSQPFIVLQVPELGPHPAQRWHLTEAWWASHVSPPAVGAMFRWLVPREMIRLWRRIVGGIASEGSVFFKLVDALFLPLFLLPATALVILGYIVFRIMQLVPFEKVRDFAAVKAINVFLVDWFGDVRVLIADRAQAANIRSRVASAIRDCLDAGCGTIVLVGHSGGTIVGYTTLADEALADLPVRTFITHGQALGMAWRLGHIDDYDTPDRRPDRLYRGDRLRTNLANVGFRGGLRWYDFWATHDPAPAGGLEADRWASLPRLVRGASIRVFNRMSLRNDHGGYWDNDEEFVLPVARLIDLAADRRETDTDPRDGLRSGPRARSRFFPEAPEVDPATDRPAHRQARVKLLQFAWVSVMTSAAVAVPLAIIDQLSADGHGSIARAGTNAWQLLGEVVRVGNPVLTFFGIDVDPFEPLDTTWAVVAGIVVLLLAYWLVGLVMSSLWSSWDARERELALQPIPGWRPSFPIALQLGLCSGAALWLFTFAVSGSLLLALPSAVAIALAYLVGAFTEHGVVRRPTRQELQQAGVDPTLDQAPGAAPPTA